MPEPDAAPAPADADGEKPKSLVEKLGAALPIGLTALAAIFGSMSNEALQHAMFWKSQAAQDQAKATNQWSLAGFKRDRSLIMQATAAQMRAAAGFPEPFQVLGERSWMGGTPREMQDALFWLSGDGPPPVKPYDVSDAPLIFLMKGIREREPEADVLRQAGKVEQAKINAAIDAAEKAAEQTDKEWESVLKSAAKHVEDRVKATTALKPDDKGRAAAVAQTIAVQAAWFELEQRRYRLESTLNQGIGYLYEARVKVSSAESDKHRRKSEWLGHAMLVAQIAAVAASLALARKRQSLLWLLAGLIGLAAVGVGGYAMLPMLLPGMMG